ncbi:hypothetical protein ACE6H2_018427 [Prunus campanulata]
MVIFLAKRSKGQEQQLGRRPPFLNHHLPDRSGTICLWEPTISYAAVISLLHKIQAAILFHNIHTLLETRRSQWAFGSMQDLNLGSTSGFTQVSIQ